MEEKKGLVGDVRAKRDGMPQLQHQAGRTDCLLQAEDPEQVGRVTVTSVWGKMYPTVSVFLAMLSLGNPMKVTGLFSVVP